VATNSTGAKEMKKEIEEKNTFKETHCIAFPRARNGDGIVTPLVRVDRSLMINHEYEETSRRNVH